MQEKRIILSSELMSNYHCSTIMQKSISSCYNWKNSKWGTLSKVQSDNQI